MSEHELIAKLTAAIVEQIRPDIPLAARLWNIEMIATYLQRSPRVVGERITTQPGFPEPIRLPATTAGKAPSGAQSAKGNPLWKAQEVIAWVEGHRDRKIGRPRKAI